MFLLSPHLSWFNVFLWYRHARRETGKEENSVYRDNVNGIILTYKG